MTGSFFPLLFYFSQVDLLNWCWTDFHLTTIIAIINIYKTYSDRSTTWDSEIDSTCHRQPPFTNSCIIRQFINLNYKSSKIKSDRKGRRRGIKSVAIHELKSYGISLTLFTPIRSVDMLSADWKHKKLCQFSLCSVSRYGKLFQYICTYIIYHACR